MTRKEQINNAAQDNAFDYFGPGGSYYDGFNDGAEWADANRWISVEDELPNSGQYVFIWDKYEGRDIGFYDGSIWIDKECGRMREHVTHFCAFPEPPKI